jgi:hypothetical protein
MGFVLYGGLGLLPLWLLIGYSLLGQPATRSESGDAVFWWSLGAVPACFMTLAFAEALMLKRERRPDPWRQHKILLIVVPMIVLLYAGGMKWQEQENLRKAEDPAPASVDQDGLRASRNSTEPEAATSAITVKPVR